jgi:hypothetical protein
MVHARTYVPTYRPVRLPPTGVATRVQGNLRAAARCAADENSARIRADPRRWLWLLLQHRIKTNKSLLLQNSPTHQIKPQVCHLCVLKYSFSGR